MSDHAPKSTSQNKNKPLLVLIEDEYDTANLVKLIMEEKGYQVVHAADGQAAQDLIVLMPPPSLILLDIQLPHVDGVTVLRTIRATPEWSDVPVIMLTAVSDAQRIQEVFSLQVQDYVLKPFQRATLIRYVERHCPLPT